jgi:DNA invertase Pin-like site-specific DNA recombinase
LILGYARVSTTDQNLDVQMEALTKAGCERVFSEKKSGKTTDGRTELEACIKFAREGDTIIVCRLDRFARSMGDFCNLVREMQNKKIGFRCLEPDLDTTGPIGELTMQILMAVAQFELSLRQDRQREGIKKAKEKGVYKNNLAVRSAGRRKRIGELRDQFPDFSAEKIGRLLGCTGRTVQRLRPDLFNGPIPEGLRQHHERLAEAKAERDKLKRAT